MITPRKLIRLSALFAVLISPLPHIFAAETNDDQPPVEIPRGPAPDEVTLYFHRFYRESAVFRPISSLGGLARSTDATSATLARGLSQALTDGPTAEEKRLGYHHFLPEGTTLDNLEFEAPDTLRIYLTIPTDFLQSPQYDDLFVHKCGEHYIETLRDYGYTQYYFYVKDPESGEYKPIRDFLPENPAEFEDMTIQPEDDGTPGFLESLADPDAESAMEPRSEPRMFGTQNGFVTGALSSKHVVLNQSHGWFDDTRDLNRWRVQRTRTWETLEDFSSAMFMNLYVAPMLRNAGATLRPVREMDMQTNQVIINNQSPSSQYTITGTWVNASGNVFNNKASYQNSYLLDDDGNRVVNSAGNFVYIHDNPFGRNDGTPYASVISGSHNASISYKPTIPKSGYYNVYISYSQGGNRNSQAHWQVHHAGGVTDFRVNQKRMGRTWVLLGNFYFEQGAPESQAKVMVLNDGNSSLGSIVTADAVRFGGGMGNVGRRVRGVSGRPRWQEEACNYLQFTGMANHSLMANDIVSDAASDERLGWSNRPQAAQWERARDRVWDPTIDNEIIYIGWHTNAFNYTCSGNTENTGTGRGSGAYRDVNEDVIPQTTDLTTKVNNAFVQSIRSLPNYASWHNRGITASNNYGECNQANLGPVPGFFFEGLFHDNRTDAAAYKDPKWRYAAARGIAQGVIEFYGGSIFPPEPPVNLRAINVNNNQVRISWNPGPVKSGSNRNGHAATQYRIYRSTNGYGFDNGTDTISPTTQFTFAQTPGETVYYRVVAVNSAGISIPTETLVARVPLAGNPTLAIVNGYTRNDQFLGPMLTQSGIGSCPSSTAHQYRTFDERVFQAKNYTVQHAKAIAAKGGYGIDSSSRNSVHLGQFSLNNYQVVFWIGGQQGEADTADGVDDTAFTVNERNALTSFLQGGRNLFITGSEMAWDYGRSGVTTDKSNFLNNILKVRYSADSSGTYTAIPSSGGIFNGLGSFTYDNGTGTAYQVRFPDVLLTNGGSVACLNYSGGTGGVAGIQYSGHIASGTTPAKIVYMGFGFETINSEPVRNLLMSRAIDFFSPTSVEEWQEF